MNIGKDFGWVMILGTRDVDAVEEVSGTAGVGAEVGMVVTESLLESMEGIDLNLSSTGHRIRRRGRCAGTIIVSGYSSDLSAYIHPMSDSGYCSRGAYCKYSHGDNAVIPSQLMGMRSIPRAMLLYGHDKLGIKNG
jgi:hypothetical protein